MKTGYCIPFELQEEIIKRIRDVKSLIRLRLVSKPWNSFICSSKFIADYHVTYPQPRHHLLVRYDDGNYHSELKYVSIADGDTFPRKEDMPSLLVGNKSHLVGSSQGLFCFYDSNGNSKTMTAVVWNPSIRKSVHIVVPNVLEFPSGFTYVGFGVCPHTSDPMLVKINRKMVFSSLNIGNNIPWQVEVFKLSSGAWRSPSCSSNLPHKSLVFVGNQVCVDGFIYWCATDNSLGDFRRLILSFDMKSEELTEICLPNSLAKRVLSCTPLYLSNLKESLVVVEFKGVGCCDVWMMEHADPKSFTNLYTIKTPNHNSIHVHGFRNTGQPIVGIGMSMIPTRKCFVYEPASEHFQYIWIDSLKDDCFVRPYMETLLLLDH